MTIATRKQREKEDMRTLIMDAARQIFLEKGYELTSIRSIAEKIEYSPGTIYLYFKDKDEIFHLLHEEGFRRLLDKMSVLAHVADPFERLKAMGHVYIDFAINNQDFYNLMFIMTTPLDHEKEHEKWQVGYNTLEFLKAVLRQCQEKGHFAGKNIDYLSFAIWSALHGMCALMTTNRCKAYPEMDPIKLLNEGLNTFISLLEKA
jgi:AcrR family transcriptional regulator